MYPLSGGLAKVGSDIKSAIELAVEIVNDDVDIAFPLGKGKGLPHLGGAKVRVVFADHTSAPEKGLSEAERLVTQEKVVALIGAYNSNVTATASQAAERLGVTQPAVSLQVRSLEKRLGTQLLDRSGRRVAPTESGLKLYRSAQRPVWSLSRD